MQNDMEGLLTTNTASAQAAAANVMAQDSVTYDEIMKAMQRVKLIGMPIIVSELVPQWERRVELDPKLDVSLNFRTEMDDWLLGFFGRKRVFFVINNEALVTHPENHRALIKACTEGTLNLDGGHHYRDVELDPRKGPPFLAREPQFRADTIKSEFGYRLQPNYSLLRGISSFPMI